MNWARIRAIMGKDVKEITANKMVIMPMIIVPVILCVVIPVVLSVLVYETDTMAMSGSEYIEELIPFYSVPEAFTELSEQILYVFLNYLFMPLFMVIPIMVSSIIAANAVVGEKERKTLETLLYTPVTNREFIVAKLSGAFLPGFIISVLAFILYFASGNIVSYLNSGTMIITSLLWVPAMLVLAPAVSALGLSVTLLVSLKAKTFMEAQQISAFVVIPFVILLIMQIAGLLIFNVWILLGICAVILIIDYVIITRISPRFSRESIVSTL